MMNRKYDKTLEEKIKNLKTESIEKRKNQNQSENQKLINYINATRSKKEKKSFWDKLFHN